MYEQENQRGFESAIRVIPRHIRQRLLTAAASLESRIQEVVLRAERPVCVYIEGEQLSLTRTGCLTSTYDSQPLFIATTQDVTECFNNVCGYSVYSHLTEIKEGFVTLSGGHRAGISGTAVVSSGSIMNIRDVSTVSLRISRQILGCGEKIASDIAKSNGGLLICGSPSSGKTTVLRDVARLLSHTFKYRVSLVDTRGELAAVCRGVSQNDVGFCDVLDGYPRAEGIEQAVRTLSPQFVVCDEIGSLSDAKALMSGIHSGVRFIATMHAGSREELLKRANIGEILSTNAFDRIVFLKGREHPGVIDKEYNIGELADV